MKRIVAVIAVFVCATLSISAFEFEDFGLTVLAERVEDGLRLTTVRDRDDREFVLGIDAPVGESEVAIIEQVVDLLYGMNSLEIDELRIVVGTRRISVQVLPHSFQHDGIDLAALTPAGIQFYFVDFLEYDFRMVVRGLFLRLRGQYVNEQLLLDRLVGAARNPEQFLQSQNPEFMLARIHELETRSLELESRADELEHELARSRSDFLDISAELEKTRNAVLMFENRGFFGGLRYPEARAVQRLHELKAEMPGLGQSAMRDRLDAEGLSLSKKEVFLLYSLYYNEFE